ncbi:MAG: hypothetical protein RSC92_04800, partial [Clostridia bacterium]
MIDNAFSNLDFDASVNDKEFIDVIINKLHNILNHTFKDINKQTISVYKDRINFCCPFCNDSVSNNRKKRGNIILKGEHANHFKCFNCGEYYSLNRFFKEFNENLDLNVLNYLDKNKSNFIKTYTYDASCLYDMDAIESFSIDRETFKKFYSLVEVNNTKAFYYLINRLQFNYNKFLYDKKKDELVILNLTQQNNIIGCQRRPLYKSENAKYRTYKLSKLYEEMSLNTQEIPEEIEAISTVFNICLINYSMPISAFEGPLDSFLFKNSIAITGLSKKLVLDIPVRYFLDSDKDAVKKSIDLINKGESVFLWKKFLSENNFPKRKKW